MNAAAGDPPLDDTSPHADRLELAGLSLASLRSRTDTAFVTSMRGVLADLKKADDAVAGFQSSP